MNWLQNLSIARKILLFAVANSLVLTGAFLLMFVFEVRSNAEKTVLANARNVIQQAESIRLEMEHKWEQKLFDTETLREWGNDGHADRVLAAVPIVTAIESVSKTGQTNNYELRVPRNNARNPDNEPDELEREVLAMFLENPDLTEHHVYDEAKNAIRFFKPIHLSNDCLICHGDPRTSQDLWGNSDGVDITGFAMDGKRSGDMHGAFEVIQTLDTSDAQARSTIWKGLITSCAVLIPCIGILTFLTHRYIVNPVKLTVDRLRDIAEGDGDLTQQLDASRSDELGQLAQWFNQFVDRIHELVAELAGSAASLSLSSGDLTAMATQLTAGASNSKQQSATISSATQELSGGMQNIADSTQEIADSIGTVNSSITGVRETIESISKNAERGAGVAGEAAQLVQASNERITTLGDAANEIGKVIEVIEDIAEQTNLLALNATIEAARAGEAGKGFTVVATEVKALAQQTALAIDDIRKRIEAIQTSTDASIESIEEIDRVIGQVNELNHSIAQSVDEQSRATIAISDSISGTSGLADRISKSISESATASREITESMSEVDAVLADIAKGAKQSQSSGEGLTELAQRMESLAKRFRLREQAEENVSA